MPILSEKERLLRKIQACSFALVEANLYLDNHPTCRDGLAYFARHKAEKEKLVAEYNEKYTIDDHAEQFVQEMGMGNITFSVGKEC